MVVAFEWSSAKQKHHKRQHRQHHLCIKSPSKNHFITIKGEYAQQPLNASFGLSCPSCLRCMLTILRAATAKQHAARFSKLYTVQKTMVMWPKQFIKAFKSARACIGIAQHGTRCMQLLLLHDPCNNDTANSLQHTLNTLLLQLCCCS